MKKVKRVKNQKVSNIFVQALGKPTEYLNTRLKWKRQTDLMTTTELKQRIAECLSARQQDLGYTQIQNVLSDCLKHIEELEKQLILSTTAGRELLERLQKAESERDELRKAVQGLHLPNLLNRCGPWKDVQEALAKIEALQPKEAK